MISVFGSHEEFKEAFYNTNELIDAIRSEHARPDSTNVAKILIFYYRTAGTMQRKTRIRKAFVEWIRVVMYRPSCVSFRHFTQTHL